MKKYLGFVVVAGLLFSFSFALAEDNGTTKDMNQGSRREAFQTKMKADREAFLESFKNERETFNAEVKAKRDEFKTANAQKRIEFWNNAKMMFTQRFDVAVTNLEKVQVRVGDLIVKLNAENKDTTAAAGYLDASKQKLVEAKAKLAEVKALLPGTGEQVTPETFANIKLGARAAKDLLKEAHHDLMQAVKEIKTLNGENTTSDNNNDNNNNQ